MPNERENISTTLNFRDFVIAGNELRAWYDENGELVFVIDYEINENKQNALLIIESNGKRKWDDILENDYNVNLEDVRPKRDNKYQKLDIEYSGLGIYEELIHEYENGADINSALRMLNQFRDIAVRRAASERLVVAETVAENARETINRAKESIDEMAVRVRELRGKLSDLRKNIGTEPTVGCAYSAYRIPD